MEITSYRPEHLEHIIELSLKAWAPVFDSIQQEMNPEVYKGFYPEGWQKSQADSVKATVNTEDVDVFVAIVDTKAVAFTALKLNREESFGEIYMIAVHPDYQRQGISSALGEHALAFMKEQGLKIAMVETGGDQGHSPARQSYEKLGFEKFPVARYFKRL